MKFLQFFVPFVGEELTAFGFVKEEYEQSLRTTCLDVCIFPHFKVNCEVIPLCSFANFKLVMSCHRKELRGALKPRGPRPWPIWPIRKSVTMRN